MKLSILNNTLSKEHVSPYQLETETLVLNYLTQAQANKTDTKLYFLATYLKNSFEFNTIDIQFILQWVCAQAPTLSWTFFPYPNPKTKNKQIVFTDYSWD